jgi:flagellar protein FliS
MLIDGALAKLSQAKGHLKNNNISSKGSDLSTAISIIGGLRDSLDHEKGGSISKNLEDLYEYMTYRIMEANLKNDIEMIDEVHGLLMEIKTAWDEIAPKPEMQVDNQSQFEKPAA